MGVPKYLLFCGAVLCVIFCKNVDARRTRKKCPQNIEAPSNGYFTYSKRGTSAYFNCNKGYDALVLGPTSIRCNTRTGQWRNLNVERLCDWDDNICIELSSPDNGFVYYESTDIGSQAYYSCDPGYSLDGLRIRTCDDYRDWTGFEPDCIPDEQYELKSVLDNLKNNILANYEERVEGDAVAFSVADNTNGAHIIFLIDGSASLSKRNFKESITFVNNILGALEDSIPGALKVTAVSYSDTITNSFEKLSVAEAQGQLATFTPAQGSTRTDLALTKIKGLVKSNAGVLQMVFMLTDGYEDELEKTIFEATGVKNRKADIYAIGVGNSVNEVNLHNMVSEPVRDHYIHIRDYGTLHNINTFIDNRTRSELCGMKLEVKKAAELSKEGGGVAHVAGGHEITRGDSPWTVYIKKLGSREVKCAGVVICKRYILTAAECVYEDGKLMQTSQIQVTTGQYHRLNGGKSVQTVPPAANGCKVHPDYEHGNADNNIALIYLTAEVRLDNYTRVVCVPKPGDRTRLGLFGDVTEMIGWGATTTEPEERQSWTPLRATGTIGEITNCVSQLEDRNMTFNSTTMHCLNGDFQTLCNGDSGSGLVMTAPKADDPNNRKRNFVVGIASAGDPKVCNPEVASATEAVNIHKYLDWIQAETGGCNEKFR